MPFLETSRRQPPESFAVQRRERMEQQLVKRLAEYPDDYGNRRMKAK
ncbi:MAG: hypothetical protein HDT14_08165 [Oscillibacter sp.]|nr:hypothetical protein [Oscillibacter sp.]